MKVPFIILMGTVLFGAKSTTTYGYRQVINHNNNHFWTPQPANSYRFHYSTVGRNTIQPSNPRWNDLLYAPRWQNGEGMRSQWQNRNTFTKWPHQRLKNKFRNAKSKPHHPKNPQLRPLPGGHMTPKSKYSSRANAAAQREWPQYIPPITMIKLPRDTPPDP